MTLAVASGAFCATDAIAQTAAPAVGAASSAMAASATPATPAPERQKQALDALNAMGVYLRSMARFEVDANSATDAVLDSGQTVSFLHRTVLKVARPDRLHAEIYGARGARGLVYDGRAFTIFNTGNRYYSRNPAPPTLDGLVRELSTVYNIEVPLADLFYWGNGKVDDAALTSALFIGLEKIDSRWCNHYAFQQNGVDWELWLQSGTHPLPCRMAIVDTTQDARPRHVVTYHWKVNPDFAASTFSYRPPADAHAVPMRPVAQSPYQQGE
ncbi:DUF2092 domain-containing protein [Paraburkholderia sp.]|uniref:DUF2092 domain-containing protein n=1 Tax=Paraburkholderia sp. TaxID=1926495 RepID=UPI00239589F6|nr:DUF2092 domain-containing protein [Paraburkholderia sp.]MDE1179002.1 DUF2092 domain-containing protein [Paraburkholderia sp.]